MRDHRDFTKPLEFLKHRNDEWQEINQKSEGYSHTNRLRRNQIIALFNSYGFNLQGAKPLISLRPDPNLSSQFIEPYKSMSGYELFTMVEVLIFKKNV
jgi:hypothetical protein